MMKLMMALMLSGNMLFLGGLALAFLDSNVAFNITGFTLIFLSGLLIGLCVGHWWISRREKAAFNVITSTFTTS